jgi:flagellar hook protein FlgE
MAAQTVALTVSANNVANYLTPGFKASRVDFSELSVAQGGAAPNGLRAQLGRGVEAKTVAPDASNAKEDAQGASDVDLIGEFAAILQNGMAFKASAKTASAADKMLESLLSS